MPRIAGRRYAFSDPRKRETTIKTVREYGIGERDPFWGNRPIEERRELIRAAAAA